MSFCALLNVDVSPALLRLEVSSTFQIPGFQIIGLPAPEVSEAKERVKAAILSCGLDFPRRKLVINLSPASVRKTGTGVDLGIALAVLESLQENPFSERILAWGELGLTGEIYPVGQMTRLLSIAQAEQITTLIVSKQDLPWLCKAAQTFKHMQSFTDPLRVIAADTLKEAWEQIQNPNGIRLSEWIAQLRLPQIAKKSHPLLPLAPELERVIAISALGRHHFLLLGPRGIGKTYALEWSSRLQCAPSGEAVLERLLAEELHETHLRRSLTDRWDHAPCRYVGAHARPAALIGSSGAQRLRPGEFSLAHGGLLIADEFPEWHRDSRELLREPLEKGVVTLSRTHGRVRFPAKFVLAATGNLCPCGGASTTVNDCRCTPKDRERYISKLSGPILDRIDLVFIQKQKNDPVAPENTKHSLSDLKKKIEEAQVLSRKVWNVLPGEMSSEECERLLQYSPVKDHPLLKAVTSLRSRHKLFRVALSLALWEGKTDPDDAHITEAFLYRPENYQWRI